MTSAIDPTKPTTGTALTADVRQNFATAANEISDLQARVAALEALSSTYATTQDLETAVTAHDTRVRAVGAINNTVANGGILQFDTIDLDSDGFAPITPTFDTLTIPPGLDGIYILTAWSSGSGNQSTTLGMGVLINGVNKFSDTNQSIAGPGSVNYTLDCGAVEVLRLAAGDTLQLINNSVSTGPNVFRSVVMALALIALKEVAT